METEQIKQFLESAMVSRERDDKTNYMVFNEDTAFKPYWSKIKDILFKGDFKINEFHYDVISEAFDSLRRFIENGNEFSDYDIYENAEADIYTYNLLQWLQEDLYNISYVDEVMQEMECKDFIVTLQCAQQKAKADIYSMAVTVIEHLAGEC